MYKKSLLWLVLAGAMLLIAGCAGGQGGGQQAGGPYYSDSMARPSQAEIENRILQELEGLGENELAALERSGQLQHREGYGEFPITINERVEFFITYYQTKMPARFTRYLNRSGRYQVMMCDILKEYGLPEDLFYIALIESGFTNSATSHAGAGGPWQFMPATARRFGLRVDNWVDERRDPVKATHAAAQYLKFLYGEFGSWYLAAAGYNAGENKIRKALTMYGVNDFWSISQSDQNYLAEETKQYVPRMIAAAIIAKEPDKYGFTDVKYESPFSYDEMTIHPTTSLAAIAKAAGVDTNVLTDLNPELKRAASPPGGMYTLRIPEGSYAKMTQAYASLTPQQRMAQAPATTYRVAKGDNLGSIARRHGCTLSQLYAANPRLSRNSTLQIGQVLHLPGSARSSVNIASNSPPQNTETRATVNYQVRGGDTLLAIAQRNNCSTAQIYALNPGLNNKPDIKAGQTLRVPGATPVPAPVTVARSNNKPSAGSSQPAAAPAQTASSSSYKVRSGDTLLAIAQRNKCSVAQIYALNPALNNKPNIKVGQALRLPGAASSVSAVASASNNKPVLTGGGNSRTVVHKVQAGDTIYSLARSYNMSTQELSKQLGRQTLYAGEKLTLSVPASRVEARSSTPTRAASQEAAKYYVVQRGDTLWGVSSRFNVSVNDIKRINNLRSDNLSIGTRLQLK